MQSLLKRRRAPFLPVAAMLLAACVLFAAGFAGAPSAFGQTIWVNQNIHATTPSATTASAPVTVAGAFGTAVVVDGNTAFVGAPLTSFGDDPQQGAVYVFSETSDLTWEQTAVLTAADGSAYDQFGAAIAVAGSNLIVGAPSAAVNGNLTQGAVYVFSLNAGSWTQAQKLVASDGAAGDEFGGTVAMDGTHMLVGARHAAVGANSQQGAVYAFEFAGGSWSEVQKLLSADGAGNDLFGTAIALEGSTALIGAPGAAVGGAALRGAVYAFNYSGVVWSQSQKLIAADGFTGDLFGTTVAINGTTALIGAPQATVSGNVNQGKVYSFTETGMSWSQAAVITAEEGAKNEQFGTALALAGSQAFIGAKSETGYTYLFDSQGGTWTLTNRFVDGINGGQAVALQDQLLAVGVPGQTGGTVSLYLQGDLSLSINAPAQVNPDDVVSVNIILTNNAATKTPPLRVLTFPPEGATSPSATPTQGECIRAAAFFCSFEPLAGNGGTVKVNVEYVVTEAVAASTITQSVNVVDVVPSVKTGVDIRVKGGNNNDDGGGGSLAFGLLAALALLASAAAGLRRRL